MLYGSFPPKKNILRERYPILIQPLPSKEPSIAEKKKREKGYTELKTKIISLVEERVEWQEL